MMEKMIYYALDTKEKRKVKDHCRDRDRDTSCCGTGKRHHGRLES